MLYSQKVAPGPHPSNILHQSLTPQVCSVIKRRWNEKHIQWYLATTGQLSDAGTAEHASRFIRMDILIKNTELSGIFG